VAVRVFISYAHESDELSDEVLELSNYLRSQGIDSEIDQYEEAPPEGWPKWMVRQIQEADYVLIVCSELFYKRANDTSGNDDGLGVKWETSLILQQLYTLNTNNKKYIPIVLHSADKKHIPLPLQPYTYYLFKELEDRDKLRDRILGISKSKRPPLGTVPEHEIPATPLDYKERKSMFFSSIIDLDLWNEAKWKAMVFMSDPSLQDAPIVGFVFENNKVGNDIFSSLKKRFGDVDCKEEIRLSFIGGISKSNPQDYKVHIGTDRSVILDKIKDAGLKSDESLFVSLTRIHEMNPPKESKNLEVFKHSFDFFKKYYITNFTMVNGQLRPEFNNLIEKKRIFFREKQDIIKDKNDEDIVVFSSEKNT